MKKKVANPIFSSMASSIVVAYALALLAGILVLLLFVLNVPRIIEVAASLSIFVVATVLMAFFAIYRSRKVENRYNSAVTKGEWYEKVLDAVPFPVHVMDNDMNWTFMNLAFEKMIADGETIKDRRDAYGKQCANARASICGTTGCGVAQLKKGIKESYFEWNGMDCKQDTSYLTGKDGGPTGYVEVVTDVSRLVRLNRFYQTEIERLVNNLSKISTGDTDIDTNISPIDKYNEDAYEYFTVINENLNEVRNSIDRVVSDSASLMEAAEQGRLDVRADAARHSGRFRDAIDGVNEMLDAISGPVEVALDYVRRLANGEFRNDLDNHYNGIYHDLVDGLDKVRDSVVLLVGETTKLTEAAVEGRLTTRGDTEKVSGFYREIIDGMNHTLDAMCVPMEEAERVLSRMAANDFTQGMPEDYKGVFGELADSVNRVKLNSQDVEQLFVKIAHGDLSLLDMRFEKSCENDHLNPAIDRTVNSIGSLLKEATALAGAAARGDLKARGDESKVEGGYREIIAAVNKTIDSVVGPLREIANVLKEWASGDLAIYIQSDYSGAYAEIKEAVNNTKEVFNRVIFEIMEASSQVSAGSKQVSIGSQELSRGSTEQASSVEQLNTSISEIAEKTRQNAINATKANKLTLQVRKQAAEGSALMKKMMEAINEIRESSSNISKIVKAIDGIAFQTNILALNAAVEAARAGQAGKGFAVVAEEVRNLAGRSAASASETTALIESSIARVKAGTDIANEMFNELEKIVGGIEESSTLISEIAESSGEQATGLTQIDKGIEQVSQVVQTNSATAEQSAAASEELNGQAEELRRLVDHFKLDSDVNRPLGAVRPKAPGRENEKAAAQTGSDGDYGKY